MPNQSNRRHHGLSQARERLLEVMFANYECMKDIPSELVFAFNRLTSIIREDYHIDQTKWGLDFEEWWELRPGFGW